MLHRGEVQSTGIVVSGRGWVNLEHSTHRSPYNFSGSGVSSKTPGFPTAT